MIEVYDFGGQKVRTAGTHEAPLFCAADVCAVLGIADVSNACERLDGDELHAVSVPAKNSHTGIQTRLYKTTFVTESGLFALILGSRKPEAKANDPLTAYLSVDGCGVELVHHRSVDTHESIFFPPGKWQIFRQREHAPEGWRRVQD